VNYSLFATMPAPAKTRRYGSLVGERSSGTASFWPKFLVCAAWREFSTSPHASPHSAS